MKFCDIKFVVIRSFSATRRFTANRRFAAIPPLRGDSAASPRLAALQRAPDDQTTVDHQTTRQPCWTPSWPNQMPAQWAELVRTPIGRSQFLGSKTYANY